jgi:hypothetical protein
VTDAGEAELQKALPDCRIQRLPFFLPGTGAVK